MLRLLFQLSTLFCVKSQADILPVLGGHTMVPGGQGPDQNGCVTDGGYSWCESSQRCIRPWEEECSMDTETQFCSSSNIQMCRQLCAEPECHPGQCAMRQGNCCDYICIETPLEVAKCGDHCPPQPPCPAPGLALAPGCRYTPPVYDNCGCTVGCGSIDCSHNNRVGTGETCGGYMPYGMASVCEDGLECVNTMGPQIADAPGTCQPLCKSGRDINGNCMDVRVDIPWNCASWYDGCNTCSVSDGVIGACTLMMCFTNSEPYCSSFYSGSLRQGDLCYRFCEDGSKTQVDRRKDCPINTDCVAENNGMISFDSCSNVMKCIGNIH
jgi:hypothetical protein